MVPYSSAGASPGDPFAFPPRNTVTAARTGRQTMKSGHAPTETIAAYAAGALTPGMTLLVASHLSYCPACRDKASRLEALAGALLADCPPTALGPRCLKGALDRIAAGDEAAPPRPPAAELPRPLSAWLGKPLCALGWRAVLPGLTACALDGFPRERVGLMRGDPGVAIPAHCPSGKGGALVLAGRLREGADTYRCGDLALPRPPAGADPEVVGNDPCLCLVVRPARP
jgi:putative transcriptional regulator